MSKELNMLNKTRNILAILLGALVIFSIIYGVVGIIASLFEKPNIVKADESKLYMIDSNRVTSHSNFYYLEGCLKNLFQSAKLGKYNEIYEIYIEDYVNEMSKENVIAKLKEFSNSGTDCKLKKAYKVNDELYIAEYEYDDIVETMFIKVGTDKGNSYQFALIIEEE
jgi:hypothetical protein